MRTHFAESERDDEDKTPVLVEYTFTPGDPGRISGPPEDCYPPEGPEIEIVAATVNGEKVKLTAAEDERIYKLIARTHEEPGPDPDEAHDRWREDREMDLEDGSRGGRVVMAKATGTPLHVLLTEAFQDGWDAHEAHVAMHRGGTDALTAPEAPMEIITCPQRDGLGGYDENSCRQCNGAGTLYERCTEGSKT